MILKVQASSLMMELVITCEKLIAKNAALPNAGSVRFTGRKVHRRIPKAVVYECLGEIARTEEGERREETSWSRYTES